VAERENYVYKLPSGEIVSIYSDETPRKQAEEELQKQYEMFYNVTELSSSAILIFDITGKVLFANNMAEEVFEIEKEKIMNMNINQSETRYN
jgi:PAS domain-containing protein